tara:strand:+ start:10465 stop:10977 length:513 start_codon:yes stop_codon:yes gene_type:complete
MNTYNYDSNEYNEWNKGNLIFKEKLPLIVYHGTKEGGYDNFDPDEGLNSEACTNGIDAGLGVFWTEEKEHAEIYTSNPYGAAYYSYNPYLYRAAIKMTNPYKIDSEEVHLKVEEHGNAVNFREYLKNEGYDGVIIDFGNRNEYVTFYSDQVNVFEAKSLLKNKNTIKNKP